MPSISPLGQAQLDRPPTLPPEVAPTTLSRFNGAAPEQGNTMANAQATHMLVQNSFMIEKLLQAQAQLSPEFAPLLGQFVPAIRAATQRAMAQTMSGPNPQQPSMGEMAGSPQQPSAGPAAGLI